MDQKRPIDCPRPGWFRVRKHRTIQGQRANWVPAQISSILPLDPVTGEILDRSPQLEAFIQDQSVPIEWVWERGYEITLEDWKWLTALTALKEHSSATRI